MNKVKRYRFYHVCSGSPLSGTYVEAKTLKDARRIKREYEQSNPHQGGGYHIIRITTVETTTVVK